ncbi:MAG: gliding motility-associated C-terminal domain-containing protein [Flavobacterium sp. JAD_PAG50586_2]|nr:MAG: gliding motility-associated C-terminal domain-containing protein [Flavobacterium sp. JAD_PAG50586_2]
MKKLFFILVFTLFAQASYSQLDNFILTVTHTDESCTGNASLSFNSTNTTPGSVIVYRIYRLPDVVNAITVTAANTFGGLTAGNYRVVATQTLGNDSGTQQQDVVILDTRTYITFQTSGIALDCDTGTITVNVLTGNPATYEIVSGPVIVAPQTSNSFTNLPSGTYNIRVNDVCGEGVVQTYTLLFSNPPNLTISTPSPECALTSCNTISVSYLVNANGTTNIRYPLTVEVTVFPPGGGTPIVQNQIITSGDPSSLSLSTEIPFYYGQLYTYNIRVVDACGNLYTRNNIQVNLQLTLGGEQTYSNCIKGIQLQLCNFLPPYTVTFLSAPAGFNPTTYNGQHPGPFTSAGTNYISTPTSEIPNGTYQIQVTDACNHTATTQVIVRDVEPLYTIVVLPATCDINTFVQIPRDTSAGPFISTAIITSATATLPSPIPYDVTSQISSGILLMELPPGTYTIQGMDVCGHPYSYTFTMPPKIFNVTATPNNITGCSANAFGSIRITSIGALLSSIIITQAPPAFTQPLPYNASSLIPTGGSALLTIFNLPAGTYTLEINDSCNNQYTRVVTIMTNISVAPLVFADRKGCGDNLDSITLFSQNGALQTVIITAAPPSFPFTLPYDVSFNIASIGIFFMNSFPEGSYTFFTRDICNNELTSTYNLTGYRQGGTIQVNGNCGSFDLNMNFTDNTAAAQFTVFWLQKFNPLTNQWTHPITGAVYPANSNPNATNSYSLNNNAINYNIVATGTFRVITHFNYYSNGLPPPSFCVQTVKTFDYDGGLQIVSAYSIPCVNGANQVFVIANGAPPLNYRITSMNGAPFIVNNGTSNSFAGLMLGTYNFRVQDACGNIVNRLFDITTLQEPSISASNLCDGLSGSLSVQAFSFLNYEWWKDNNTANILSTTNTLTFNPFTNANAGVYHVRIWSTTLNSCVDRILTYTIAPSTLPNAGLDGSRVICMDDTPINLFTILNGPYDAGGIWVETTSSGMLVGSNWSPAGLPVGTYTFTYTVNGFCNTVDDATVTVTINAAVEVPVISVAPAFCPGEDLNFSIQPIVGATYQWTGPNSFTSALQNPTIPNATDANSGTYTIKATIGNCESEANVVIVTNPVPDYTYETACQSGAFTVKIVPTQNSSFDPNTATYAWTGPNSFTSTSNPLILTNQPIGVYNVLVTNDVGCFSPQEININRTFCDFPSVVTPDNDGTNDDFDLTNYDVDLLQIFSRWGRLVYEEHNYLKGWYGQNMHGGFLPDSTYYYFVRLKNGQEKHGWVFVGRG